MDKVPIRVKSARLRTDGRGFIHTPIEVSLAGNVPPEWAELVKHYGLHFCLDKLKSANNKSGGHPGLRNLVNILQMQSFDYVLDAIH
jgi:hypothetical protein